MSQNETNQNETITAETLQGLGITIETTFVPWSKSRNYKDGASYRERSFNFKVIVKLDGRWVGGQVDYMMGLGHSPSNRDPKIYLLGTQTCSDSFRNHCRDTILAHEAEFGIIYQATERSTGIVCTERPYPQDQGRKRKITPDPVDVLWCLVQDSYVLDYPDFETWASDYGCDTDSRKAEQVYQACLRNSLRFRAGLGDELLSQLKELYQDY